MASLPAGWLDCGITHTQTLSLQAAPRAFLPGYYDGFPVRILAIEGWILGSNPLPDADKTDCNPDTLAGQYGSGNIALQHQAFIVEELADFSTAVLLDLVNVDDCNGAYHALQTCTKTFGPLRLGVTVEFTTFSGNRNLRYAWFADSATETKTVLAGTTIYDSFDYGTPTLVGKGTQLQFSVNAIQSSFPGVVSAVPVVKITNVQADGVTIGLSEINFPWVETSAGTIEAPWRDTAPFGGYGSAYAPSWQVGYDIDVRWAGGEQTAAEVELYDPIGGFIRTFTSPAADLLTLQNTSWDIEGIVNGDLRLRLSSAWAGAQTPTLPAGERAIQCSRTKPKRPSDGPESWSPLELTIASPVPVLLSTNLWAASGSVAVAGNVFTVTGAGSSVSRTLLSRWRNWNVPADPDYHADDRFETTKHNFYAADGQDVWGWSLYAYLDVGFTCPSSSTLTFTLSIAVPGAVPYLFTRTYTKAFPSGASVQRIDLLFPDDVGASPCFFERVDDITVAGFNNGAYTLGVLQLVGVESAYVKIAARGGWTGADIAMDGSGPSVQFGENEFVPNSPGFYRKADEDGTFATDTGQVTIGGCFRMDGTLADVADQMNRMEGLTAAYNSTAMDADLIDTFGNQIGFENGANVPLVPQGNWLEPNLPHDRVPTGSLSAFPASIPCDSFQLVPAPAGTFVTVWRRILGMVVESLVTTEAGGRNMAGARVALQIAGGTVPDPMSDPVVMVAVTDASGYAWAWVGTGDYLGFGSFTVYFTGVS